MSPFTTEDTRLLLAGDSFQLADVDPKTTPGFDGSSDDLDDDFFQHDEEIGDLQEKLWARKNESILILVQGMDTSGKGGMVKHLSRLMHPLGVRVVAFGAPTQEEREQDFLWRIRPHLPKPGEIVIFDRSHYEDVLIQRVEAMAPPEEIERRYEAIREFEQEIVNSGTHLVKIMLHISRDFQYENIYERLTEEDKKWKYDPADLVARAKWSQYQAAYQIAIQETMSEEAPWYVIPGDNKKYARMVVKHILVDLLRELDGPWPAIGEGLDEAEELEKLERS